MHKESGEVKAQSWLKMVENTMVKNAQHKRAEPTVESISCLFCWCNRLKPLKTIYNDTKRENSIITFEKLETEIDKLLNHLVDKSFLHSHDIKELNTDNYKCQCPL